MKPGAEAAAGADRQRGQSDDRDHREGQVVGEVRTDPPAEAADDPVNDVVVATTVAVAAGQRDRGVTVTGTATAPP